MCGRDLINNTDEEYWILNGQSNSIFSRDCVAMGDERKFQR